MTSLISLPIWLGLSLISACEVPPSQQPQQTVRVFADLKHTGFSPDHCHRGHRARTISALWCPCPQEAPVAIDGPRSLVPLIRWSNGWGGCELRQCRVRVISSFRSPATLAVACGSFAWERAGGGIRRRARINHGLWRGKDGSVELGVGVMIPEAKGDAAGAVWPRAFTVEISTKSPEEHAGARAVPRGALCDSVGTRAGRRVADRLARPHGGFGPVRGGVRVKNRDHAGQSRGRRTVRSVDARHD